MENEKPLLLVLRGGTHGLSPDEYAEALRARTDEFEIVVAQTPREERELIRKATVVTGLDISENLVAEADELELFAGVAAGYGHLPLDALVARDIIVTNASGIHAPNIAEQALGYVLMFTRRLHEGLRKKERREWRHYQADELKGSTVTVVGVGTIGEAILKRARSFEVETVGVRHTPEKGGPADEIIGYDTNELHRVLARTDVLILSCPLTDLTEGLIGAEEFTTLPEDAIVVNVGRGKVIDTDDLISAIQLNSLDGVALDVTDPEPLPQESVLWDFENVLITPHNAGHSPKHWDRLAEIVSRNSELVKETKYDEIDNVVSK